MNANTDEHDVSADPGTPEEQRDKRRDAPETDAGAADERTIEELEVTDEVRSIIEQLEAERDEAVALRQRTLADYANYQRRADENERRARIAGVHAVLRSLLPVLDQFELALNQSAGALSMEQLLGGVKIVRDELRKTLESHGAAPIMPEVGEEFDPRRHEAVMRQAREGVEPNHVVMVMQTGYAVGDAVLRPAKVAVAPGED